MYDGLTLLGTALLHLASPQNLFTVFWATLVGIAIGMLPGLTVTMGLALFASLTFTAPPEQAILVLIAIYNGAIYGGSRSAILLNIPGTPANAAAAMDGHPLARQGRAGYAMGVATSGSGLGTLIGIFFLALCAPLLADYALEFGSIEFFWLAIFGIVISGHLTAVEDPIKGWLAGLLGLLVAMIGRDGIHAEPRFSYGILDLEGGIGLIPAMVGAFGFSEILSVMKNPRTQILADKVGSVIPRLADLWRYKMTILRSGVIGTFMGAVPGVGEDVGSWVSYAAARKFSKEGDRFGKGSTEGLMAAETGNNAAAPGAVIPVLTLAIPGSAPSAVLLAALFIHGLRPGPMIMVESPDVVFQIVAMFVMSTLAMVLIGVLMVKPLLQIFRVPREKLMPVVFVLCVIGAFAVQNRMFDVWVMLVFGVVGFVLREWEYPMAPLILGIILGDILDKSLRRSLVFTHGDVLRFFERPISFILFASILLTVLFSIRPVRHALRSAWWRLTGRGDGRASPAG